MTLDDQGKVITLRATIAYPGSRITDLLIGGEKVSLNNEVIATANVDRPLERLQHPADATRKHVPELERWAYNQMPKTSDHHEVKLYRYVGTDLYQWYSKVGTSVFSEPVGEPFLGAPA